MMQLPLNINLTSAGAAFSAASAIPEIVDENTELTITSLEVTDFAELLTLWKRTEQLNLGLINTEEDLEKYLSRNPALSCVAKCGDKIIGALLCGHDGLVGYIHHLAVDGEFRRLGVGKTLVTHAVATLETQGISRCNIVISKQNTVGATFWNSLGWLRRSGVCIMRSK